MPSPAATTQDRPDLTGPTASSDPTATGSGGSCSRWSSSPT